MTTDRSHGQALYMVYSSKHLLCSRGEKIAGVVTLWFWPSVGPAQYDSPWEGFLTLCPSHHALDDATDGVCCHRILDRFWAVGVRISYGCNTVRLSGSSKRTTMD